MTILVLTPLFSTAQADWESELKLTKYDSILHKRIYEIGIEDYQIVQLIEFQNGKFEGALTNSVWTTNRKEEKIKRIIQKTIIPELIVENLINKLEQNNFENILSCDENEGCLNGLDGTTTFFNIKSNKITRTISFWELESNYYYKEPNIPNNVKQSRKIIELINMQFDLKQQFENFTSRLPFGKYIYSSIIMERKRKNAW